MPWRRFLYDVSAYNPNFADAKRSIVAESNSLANFAIGIQHLNVSMRILHISDTHSQHRKLSHLPDADVLVHSGDFTMTGTEREVIDFLNWFGDLPYAHKIFISGNHDDCLYEAKIDGLDKNVHYLCNSGVEISGVKFYGVPMFLYDCITERQSSNYARIPDYTDVLITHCPPYGILDSDDGIHYGSQELLTRISALKLKAHLFGHIHTLRGQQTIKNTVFSNGSVMNSEYNTFGTIEITETSR